MIEGFGFELELISKIGWTLHIKAEWNSARDHFFNLLRNLIIFKSQFNIEWELTRRICSFRLVNFALNQFIVVNGAINLVVFEFYFILSDRENYTILR